MTRAPHPDYDAAASAERWSGSLAELRRALELRTAAVTGRWFRFVLPGGAWVAMRRGPGGRLLAIGRHAKKPRRDAWDRELATFRDHLELDDWTVYREKFAPELQATVYREGVEAVR